MNEEEKPLTVAIYARISKQEENLDNQLLELRDYCIRKKYKIYKEYADIASGATESRPQLDLMMKDGFQHHFDCVVVWKLDRLGRSLKHLVSVVSQWQKYNINFICTTQQFDTTTSNGKLLFHIFSAIAEFERELISERTLSGLERAKKKLEKEGRTLGRPKGSKDVKPRKKGGYYLRYNDDTKKQLQTNGR